MSERSLAARAAWVVAVAAGFWVMALGITGMLVFGGWAIVTYAPEDAVAGFVAWGLAAVLAFGFMPRVSFKKEEIAPPLPPGEQPRLHAFVRDVAARAGGRAPDALYLSHDANAFAGLRRTRLLAKRESIVGLGLPLLALLTEDEARSVLAHEIGHHVGGDVELGPWVHRTRRAIARAVDRLDGSSFWLHLPFVAYAKLFLRTSMRISRAQELSADAVAAKVAGRGPTASALRKTDVLSSAWTAYFGSEVVPLLAKGHLPPLIEGFELYWHAAQTPDTPAYGSLSAALEASRFTGDEDTHPSLGERIAALGDPPPESSHAAPALGLLDDVPRVEEKVLRELLLDPNAKLAPIAWDGVADAVWLPLWREAVAGVRPLAALAIRALPRALEDWEPIADATRRGPRIASPAAERRRVARLLGAWLVVKLADAGFRVTAPPGLAVRAEREGRALEPFKLADDLASDKLDKAAWTRLCEDSGL